jgi:hypothetical protein
MFMLNPLSFVGWMCQLPSWLIRSRYKKGMGSFHYPTQPSIMAAR